MKLNLTAIIGLLLIVVAVFAGYILDFNGDWIAQAAGAAAGLGLIINAQVKKKEKARWKVYLIAGGVVVGVILAVVGGVSESIITTVVGSVLVIAGAAVGIVSGARNG